MTFAAATPIAEARTHLNHARTMRSEWLVSIAHELVTVDELITHAATADGAPLLKLQLRQILSAQPTVGLTTADNIIATMCRFVGLDAALVGTKQTVAWLLDPRCQGTRWLAWCDTRYTKNATSPWPGFPLTTAPEVTALRDFLDLGRQDQ